MIIPFVTFFENPSRREALSNGSQFRRRIL